MVKHSISAHINIAPQFYDIDPMNVVWHGNYVKYFEEVRSVLLDQIGHNYQEMLDSGFAWPIVDMRIKYVKPLTLHQKIRLTATLIEFENRLKIDYHIMDIETQEPLTKAHTIQVAVHIETQEMHFETPAAFRNSVQKALS